MRLNDSQFLLCRILISIEFHLFSWEFAVCLVYKIDKFSRSCPVSIHLQFSRCANPPFLHEVESCEIFRQTHQPLIDRDENVNGRQGLFRRYSPIVPEANVPVSSPPPAPTESNVFQMRSTSSQAESNVLRNPAFPTEPNGQNLRTLTSPPSPTELSYIKYFPPNIHLPYIDNHFSMAAFRDEPLRHDPTLNRQRQLESLRRMEEKIQSRRNSHQKVAKKRENTLAMFVLDVTKVLHDECIASWVKLQQNDRTAPDERILYSLVLGRGELIVFGGIRKEQATVQGQTDTDDSEVFNELYFLNPPRYII